MQLIVSEPKDFGGPDKATEAIFCKIRSTSCVFPFKYDNANHSSCLLRGESFWCPTKVNADLEPIKEFWGKCDVDQGKTNCDPSWTEPEPETQTQLKSKGKQLQTSKILYTFYKGNIIVKHICFVNKIAKLNRFQLRLSK